VKETTTTMTMTMTMKNLVVLALLGLAIDGCSSTAKTADGSGDAVGAMDAADAVVSSDLTGGLDLGSGDGGLQCCTATISGPGTEDCPCSPYRSQPGACQAVGRECLYDGCFDVISCACRAPEDGGAPSWQCSVLIR
jgi:hypothetical protein